MPTEIINALISSIIGGLLVTLVNYVFLRRKTQAETDKLKAEAEKIRAESKILLLQAEEIQERTLAAKRKFEDQLRMLKILIDSDVVEGYQIEEVGKKVLEKLIQSLGDEKEPPFSKFKQEDKT